MRYVQVGLQQTILHPRLRILYAQDSFHAQVDEDICGWWIWFPLDIVRTMNLIESSWTPKNSSGHGCSCPLTLFASWAGGRKKKRLVKVSLWRVRKQLLTVVPASSGVLKHLSPWHVGNNGINACCLFCFSDCYAQNPRQHLRHADLYTSHVIAH